jgi:hypothetical protein
VRVEQRVDEVDDVAVEVDVVVHLGRDDQAAVGRSLGAVLAWDRFDESV